jgi:hypothetical protein
VNEVAKGKQLVSERRYQDAVAVLVGAVSKLPWTGTRDPAAADAFLQLGLAYAGLGQSSPATSQFLQALRRDPAIAPDPQTTPAASLEVFASAMEEAKGVGLIGEPVKKRGHGRLIALGAGVLVAGGAALLAGGGDTPATTDAGSNPTISNLVLGPIQAVGEMVGTVPVEFDFRDPDGDIKSAIVRLDVVLPVINELPEALGRTEGHVRLISSIRLPPRGLPITVSVSVRDSRGSLSNSLRSMTIWP